MRPSRAVARCAAALFAVLAVAASPGAADTLEVEPAGEVTLVPLVGSVILDGGGQSIECALLLEWTLDAGPTPLAVGEQLGSVLEAEAAGCEGGTFGSALGLPWAIDYQGADGTLPNQLAGLRVDIAEMSFDLAEFGGIANCLYSGDLELQLEVTGENPYALGLVEIFEATSLARAAGGGLCPAEVTPIGGFGLEPPQDLTIDFEGPLFEFEEPNIALGPTSAEFWNGTTTMKCRWTLSGRIQPRWPLVEQSRIGAIREVDYEECLGGSVAAVLGGGVIKYVNVPSGELPSEANALALTVGRFAVHLASFGTYADCLYAGAISGDLRLSGTNPYTTNLFEPTEPTLDLVEGEALCPPTIHFRARWPFTDQTITYEEE
jgi:hypothetical protein